MGLKVDLIFFMETILSHLFQEGQEKKNKRCCVKFSQSVIVLSSSTNTTSVRRRIAAR